MRRTCYLGVLVGFAVLFTACVLPVLAEDGTGKATAVGQGQGQFFQGQERYDALEAQRSVGFAPHDSRGADRFHLLTAAERSTSSGGSGAAPSDEQAKAAELAKKLQNPIANLISVPIQNNWDFGIGPADAMRYTVNIQPVIPFSLTKDWNLITRTILPVIYAESPLPGGDNTAGLGDIVQSFFFSPKAPTRGGWIWGSARCSSILPPRMRY